MPAKEPDFEKLQETICQCSKCPSFPSGKKIVFCQRSPSEKPVEEKGCFCEECALFELRMLEGNYYCGREK
jgi:hypothetical protein